SGPPVDSAGSATVAAQQVASHRLPPVAALPTGDFHPLGTAQVAGVQGDVSRNALSELLMAHPGCVVVASDGALWTSLPKEEVVGPRFPNMAAVPAAHAERHIVPLIGPKNGDPPSMGLLNSWRFVVS